MSGVIECAGAPRDQGLDQGRACRDEVRRSCRRRPGPFDLPLPRGALEARRRDALVAREIRRHFPQVVERAAGLARGAGVSRRRLLRRLAWELGDHRRGWLGSARGSLVGAAPPRTGTGPLVAKVLELSREMRRALVLRRTRPDPGNASLEVTLAGLPAAIAGVNEVGLAVAVACCHGPAPGAPAPPPLLLVQECLQRFATVPQAVDGCERRPAGGSATVLLADAAGGLAAVEFRGEERRCLLPEDGLLLAGGPETPPRDGAARDRGAELLDVEALHRLLASLARPARGAGAASIGLDPRARRVGLALGRADASGAVRVSFASL